MIGSQNGDITRLTNGIDTLVTKQGTNVSVSYDRTQATLYINKPGVNLTGGNINGQTLVTLPDGVEIANSALVGKIAPVLDSSWVPTGDYISLGTSDKKTINVRCKSNHTNGVVTFTGTFPRQWLTVS